jgi:hypothetical protein
LNPSAESILLSLHAVAAERAARTADPVFAERVAAVKAFQHARFAHTYADLLADPRYTKAATFFLEDLYGPTDFSDRDTQFARIVPALVRMFPREIVGTVADLGSLHALSERLDSAMARELQTPSIDDRNYGQAWRQVAEPGSREQQIALMLAVGTALDKYTRNPLLRHSLRLMRSPARAAGMGALQHFLETGFDTFRAMGGAQEFLRTIAQRERALAERLFAGGDVADPSPG